MTDKEKAEEIASKIIAIDEPITHSTLINALMMMAQWKDRELLRALQGKIKELSNDLLAEDYVMCP